MGATEPGSSTAWPHCSPRSIALHPFREGNGRTQRAFLGQLAVEAGHPIHWAAMDPAENNAASKAAHEGDNDAVRSLLDLLVHRR